MHPVQLHPEENHPVPRGPTGRSPGAARGRDVLFVANGNERLSTGLLRAAALAHALGGRLIVACTAPRWMPHNMLFPHHNAAEGLAIASGHAAARDRLRAFCDAVLTERLPEDRLFVRAGGLAKVAVELAGEASAAPVVLGPGSDGKTAAEVACRARVPVLVARRARLGSIVAATDLADPRFPVLRQAGQLAGRADERATVVHNVPAMPGVGLPGGALGARLGLVPEETILSEYRWRLHAVVRSLGIAADPVVVSRPSAADAILEIAREHDADLVVVGTHARSWLARLLSPSIAEVVVDRADGSVLVMPLSGDESDGTLGVATAWAA